jgi:hypothetical protein
VALSVPAQPPSTFLTGFADELIYCGTRYLGLSRPFQRHVQVKPELVFVRDGEEGLMMAIPVDTVKVKVREQFRVVFEGQAAYCG